jgi:hypothetical protein
MATKNIVPRADSEGGIGTTLKRWASGWFYAINGKDISSGVATTAELEALTPPPSPGGEPGAVSSSTSGAAGTAATYSRSDHNHDLGEHTHRDAASGGAIGKVDYHGVETGFSSISMVGDVLTIGAATNKYWYQGVPFSTASAITCDLSSTAARDGSDTSKQTNRLYFIYFKDATGTLYWSQQQWSMTTKVPVATAYYNGSAWAVGRETHGYSRNLAWHENAHRTIGARYESGLDKTLPTAGTPATLTITSGTIYDEDIAVAIAQQTTARAWYQASSGVYTFADIALPYTGSSGAPTYLDTDTYTLAALGTNKFACYWVYASNDVSRPIYIIPSHVSDGYPTISLARAEAPPSLAGLGLSPELKLLFRWIYKSDGSFQESSDYRTSSSLPSGFTASTTASSVSFTPAGNVAATTVQAAIEELDSEKIPATTGAATSYVSAATESAAGIVELATTAEAQAGTDTSRAVTPAGLAASAKGLIATNTTIYVATTGSDTTGTGLSGAPYASIAKALSSIANKLIASGVTVTIQVADGTYTVSNYVIIDHPDAEKIEIVGNTSAETTVAITAIDTTAKTITVAGDYTGSVAVGDIIGLTGSSTSGLNGAYIVSGRTYSGGNTIITCSAETLSSATVGGGSIIVKPCNKSTLLFVGQRFQLNAPISSFSGFKFQQSSGSTNICLYSPNGLKQTVINKCIFNGVFRGVQGSANFQNTIFKGCTSSGVYLTAGHTGQLSAANIFDSCVVAVSATANSYFYAPSTYSIRRNNTTDYSPAANTVGNGNAFISL